MDKIGLEIEALEHAGDLRSATVHNDRVDPRLLQIDDVFGKGSRQGGIAHGMAAEFDDDRLLVIAEHIGERFRQNACLVMRRY